MTSGGQAALARATAAVFVDGRRAGSAVLVGPRYLVTAAHALQRQDPRTLAKVAVEQVELEFPDQGPGGQPGRTAASRVDLGPAGAWVDVAVLDLGEDRPGWLPAPLSVWPGGRLPGRVKVFGYPLAEGLRQFAAALLAQDGMDHPGPPGAAWTQYRGQPGVCDRLAAVIAERAGRNFLVAAMAAAPLSTARTMTDPAAKEFDPAGIPSGVGEALSKYLDRLHDQRQERDRGLLTALAYARGSGLDDSGWLAFAAALGYSASIADLDALRRSPAADYLLQTTTTEHAARPVTRLFHQALTD
jgi:hypothetical protein